MKDRNEMTEAEEMEWIKDFKREVLKFCGHLETSGDPAWEEQWMKQAEEDKEEIWEKISSKIRE